MDQVISIAINVDTRSNKDAQGQMFDGVRSYDFLYEGVMNKVNFFRGYPIEVILFVDVHSEVPAEIQEAWKSIPNLTVCMSKHREYFGDQLYAKWNDHNFLQALYLARGYYTAHFDGDMNTFRSDDCKIIDEMMKMVDSNEYTYISYPSPWSPGPVFNKTNEWDYWWASTRFFFCKRSALDFTEIEKCLRDSSYLYGTYGEKNKRCPWLEHVLGIIAGPGRVFYPPYEVELENYTIFSWNKYSEGTLKDLNKRSYNEVRRFLLDRGGISYPCDVSC